jgi:uncharacterized protein (TIGR03437 family)
MLGSIKPETGPPQITAIVSGASFLGDAVAPGELVVLFGAKLGPAELTGLQLDKSGRVTTSLAGTQVFVGGVAAPILYTSANQVAAMVPFGTTGSSVPVQVRYQNQSSDPVAMAVTAAAPSLVARDSSGGGLGAILNEDTVENSFDNPAEPGSVVVLYATGAGQTDPPGDDGKITSGLPYPKPLLPVQVFIDNLPADVLYAGAAPGIVQGVVQINARLPAGASSGAVTVIIQVGEAISPNTIMMVIK